MDSEVDTHGLKKSNKHGSTLRDENVEELCGHFEKEYNISHEILNELSKSQVLQRYGKHGLEILTMIKKLKVTLCA